MIEKGCIACNFPSFTVEKEKSARKPLFKV